MYESIGRRFLTYIGLRSDTGNQQTSVASGSDSDSDEILEISTAEVVELNLPESGNLSNRMGNETSSEGGRSDGVHGDNTNLHNAPIAASTFEEPIVNPMPTQVPNIISHVPAKVMDEEIAVAQPIAPVIPVKVKPNVSVPPIPFSNHTGMPRPSERTETVTKQVLNNAKGYSFKVCDMNRLRRFIVLGSENNSYYATATVQTLQNVRCVQGLLKQKRHEEVLDTIKEYSLAGRCAKEDPILQVLALCAGHEDPIVKKAAFRRVVDICNIPTKLFRFLELTQMGIDDQRSKNPPAPQAFKKRRHVTEAMEVLEITDKAKEPSESVDTSMGPPLKKKKQKVEPELKKVNKVPRKSSGWGRMRRKAIAQFYVDEKKNATRLLYLMTKYKQRHNWSHKTVVGYAHPKINGEHEKAKNLVMRYCTRGYEKVEKEMFELVSKPGVDESLSEVINYIKVINDVSKLSPTTPGDEDKLLDVLSQYAIRAQEKEFTTLAFGEGETKENKEGKKSNIHIVREHLPTGFLNSRKVWEALLCDMPMTALIRNLGKMSSMGLFDDTKNVETAVNSLTNPHKLKTARVHPMKVLIAMLIYQKGQGEKGDLRWEVNQQITKALDDAFYMSFKQPEIGQNFATNKKYMLCLDVSGSMTFRGCTGCELITPAMASVAMAWVTWNVEENVELVAFGGKLVDMKTRGFTKDMLINDVLHQTRSINFGATDCSLPMLHATQKRIEVDVFIVYTDSDTWAGHVQPVTALRDYNRIMNRNAKLIVCGMQSNGFTIADPQDPNMMDVVGFDSGVPELISEFAKDKLSGKCSDFCEECNFKTEM